MAPIKQQQTSSKSLLKQPKARVARYLKSVEPQLHETGKQTLLLKGIKSSQSMNTLLKELHSLQRPNAKLLNKKNQIVPFTQEGQQSLEFLATKNDTALIAVASHNRKRPNNLVMARTFHHQILDMCEFGVLYFKSMQDYNDASTKTMDIPKKRIGSKPLLFFCGSLWSQHRELQSLFTDFYRGDVIDSIALSGLDHVMVFTMGEPPTSPTSTSQPSQVLIHQRTYFCKLKKNPNGSSSSSVPVPYLIPCGPDLDLTVRRTQWAEPELYREARRRPVTQKKTKNQTTNLFGETIGRLHLEKQDVEHRQGRKVKALRRAEQEAAQEEREAIEKELQSEHD